MKTIDSAINIRECTLADVPELVALGIKTFRETFEAVNSKEDMDLYLSATFNEEKIAGEFEVKGSKFFIATDNGRSVGFCKLKTSEIPDELKNHRPIEIERIYAIKDCIGKGVGKALMEHCIAHGRDGGFDVIWLGVWEHNELAIAFYEKWGFEFFGQHTFMLGRDAQTDLLMKKHLS
jgi:diamine N-acetyltransferase